MKRPLTLPDVAEKPRPTRRCPRHGVEADPAVTRGGGWGQDEAIRLKPTSEAMWNGRCWTRALVGELQAALADCNEALRLQPGVAATLNSRGFTYLKMGEWDSAIGDYSSALQLDPTLASSLYGRGLAKLKKGDITGGNADVAAATKIDSKIVEDFAHYGVQ